ncbi:hypothetical protein QBC39DRAFT_20102 [Podospora conica]|nr:hypothetical protein QBC39DRAFT_20102 [Schizothecium conicum]
MQTHWDRVLMGLACWFLCLAWELFSATGSMAGGRFLTKTVPPTSDLLEGQVAGVFPQCICLWKATAVLETRTLLGYNGGCLGGLGLQSQASMGGQAQGGTADPALKQKLSKGNMASLTTRQPGVYTRGRIMTHREFSIQRRFPFSCLANAACKP